MRAIVPSKWLDMEAAHISGEVVAYYWNAYLEWRAKYTLADDCMLELVVAIRADIDSGGILGTEADRLKKLARMIEQEIAGQLEYQAEQAA